MGWTPPTTGKRQGTHIHQAGRIDIYKLVTKMIERTFAGTGVMPAVSLCKETHDVRKATDLCNANCNCLKQPTKMQPKSLPIVR